MTTLNQIRKRSGDVVSFDVTKIIEAAFAALKASGTPNREVAEHLSVDVVQELLDKGYDQKDQIPTVELVQDLLENAFVKRGLTHAAKAFIIYREEHKKAREGKPVLIDAKELVDGYINQEDWRVNENSNSGYSYASLLNHASGAVIANYTLSNVYPTEIAQAHVEGDIHLHDLSCGIVGYCAGWSLRELLEMGFKGRNGRSSANPAKHFDTALLQAVNFLCTLQTEWAGAQAFSSFDTFMAPFIRHDNLSYEKVKQCMQQFIFGLNIASRWGQCVTMDVKCLKADGTVAGYDELKIGDEIITFDVETGKLKTDTITHLTKKPHKGVAHKYFWEGNGFRNIAFTVTPEHRMVHKVKDKYYIVRSEELFNTHEYISIPEVRLSPQALKHVNKPDFSEYICLDEWSTPYRATEVEIDEDVWCPTTDTGTFVAWINGALLILGNCPFTNLTFDWVVPEDLKAHPVIIGGKLMETETYGDFQKEMDMINKAFLEVMAEGDSDGRIFTFPIPTYNITKDFNWDSENAKLLFEVTGKYGLPYFQNFINSELKPTDVRSFCCRLQLNMKELRNKTGGLFGAGEKTGSVGVVTINLPRIGYLSNTEEEYFERLDKLIDLAKQALEIKREVVQHNLDNDLMPYTKVYLGHLKQHFSTIGIIGMNESCLNFLGCSVCDPEGQEFAVKVLLHLRERIQAIQEETGHVYNLEGVPGEGTSFRLAKIDKKKFPEIICAGDKNPYYTNSTQLPVGYTTDLFEALDLQEPLQKEYTGGTVFHAFIGERIDDPNLVAELVKRIATNYKIPYFTLTPSFSICPVHGYIPGEHTNCPYAKN